MSMQRLCLPVALCALPSRGALYSRPWSRCWQSSRGVSTYTSKNSPARVKRDAGSSEADRACQQPHTPRCVQCRSFRCTSLALLLMRRRRPTFSAAGAHGVPIGAARGDEAAERDGACGGGMAGAAGCTVAARMLEVEAAILVAWLKYKRAASLLARRLLQETAGKRATMPPHKPPPQLTHPHRQTAWPLRPCAACSPRALRGCSRAAACTGQHVSLCAACSIAARACMPRKLPSLDSPQARDSRRRRPAACSVHVAHSPVNSKPHMRSNMS